jgi:hypothetical protein
LKRGWCGVQEKKSMILATPLYCLYLFEHFGGNAFGFFFKAKVINFTLVSLLVFTFLKPAFTQEKY